MHALTQLLFRPTQLVLPLQQSGATEGPGQIAVYCKVIHHSSHIDRRHIALRGEHKRILVADGSMAKMGIENRIVEGLCNLEVSHTFDQLCIERTCFRPECEFLDLITGDVPRDR